MKEAGLPTALLDCVATKAVLHTGQRNMQSLASEPWLQRSCVQYMLLHNSSVLATICCHTHMP